MWDAAARRGENLFFPSCAARKLSWLAGQRLRGSVVFADDAAEDGCPPDAARA